MVITTLENNFEGLTLNPFSTLQAFIDMVVQIVKNLLLKCNAID